MLRFIMVRFTMLELSMLRFDMIQFIMIQPRILQLLIIITITITITITIMYQIIKWHLPLYAVFHLEILHRVLELKIRNNMMQYMQGTTILKPGKEVLPQVEIYKGINLLQNAMQSYKRLVVLLKKRHIVPRLQAWRTLVCPPNWHKNMHKYLQIQMTQVICNVKFVKIQHYLKKKKVI